MVFVYEKNHSKSQMKRYKMELILLNLHQIMDHVAVNFFLNKVGKHPNNYEVKVIPKASCFFARVLLK